jgi:hypothetical protein
MSYIRKNRAIKVAVTLKYSRVRLSPDRATWIDWYAAECEHGSSSGYSRHKSEAVGWMAKPWLWCGTCASMYEARREAT